MSIPAPAVDKPITWPPPAPAALSLVPTRCDELELELVRWASELNLESRLLPGKIDLTVLEVLESGVGATIARAAAAGKISR